MASPAVKAALESAFSGLVGRLIAQGYTDAQAIAAAQAQIAASGSGYILVADSPDLICEAEAANGTPATTDIGLNISHANGARTAATITSPAYLDFGTEATTSTLNFNLRGFVQSPKNVVGASAKMLVGFNVHQFKSVGTTGI